MEVLIPISFLLLQLSVIFICYRAKKARLKLRQLR